MAAERSDHVVQAGRAPAGKRWGVRLGAAGAGAAVALAFPRPGLWWWAYAGLAPVLLLVGTAPDLREALWRCWSAGCGYFLVLYHWLLPQLSVFALPLVLAVGLVWLPWGTAAWWLLHDPRSNRKLAAALVVVPSVWVVLAGQGARLGAAAVVVLLIGGAAGYGLTRSDPDVMGTLRIGGVQPGVVKRPARALGGRRRRQP